VKKMIIVFGALLVAGAVAVGCENQSAAPAAQEASADVVPASLFVSAPPQDAQTITAAKASAKVGEKIVLKGHIGAQREPLAANRAIMTLADASLPTCDNMPGDTCKTPWDSCCEPKEEVSAKSATVQVVDKDGRPLKAGLNGVQGLKPGKEVIVAGTVKTAADQTLVVDASQIYVTP
jgi:hypothetical protein